MHFHDLVYQMEVDGLQYSIDKKTDNTWLLRVLKEDETLFHCHVLKTAPTTCFVEITYNKIKLRSLYHLFTFLGFDTILYQRALNGRIREIALPKQE